MRGEGERRYRRCVPGGTPTGWAAMAKTITGIDEDKVKGHKEDIDTLLVFTGLFSAVLTAFVIVSYAGLFPDKQDTMIQLLGQIATRNNSYTTTSEIAGSPILSQSQSVLSSQPQSSILRVNYLWFASLVISLITASFSMLVKQWLREYLAFEYTSPRERLRARQFRHPGLVTWKVYEIAGFLPLLLQLSLGLFLLGLCFFTWSAEHSIGTMCTVLVGLWAFLFISATIAPIASARCPYKTALLKHVIAALRRRCRRHLYPSTVPVGIMSLSISMTLGVVADNRFQLRLARALLEEADAIKQATDEIAILREVDSFLLDDDLLGTTILDSLVQNNTYPPDIIKFVLEALARRIKGNELDQLIQPLESPPNLQRLTKGAWNAISDIIAYTVLNGLREGTVSAESWIQDAIHLLLATHEQPLTSRAQQAVVHCVHPATLPSVTDAFKRLAVTPISTNRFHDLSGILKRIQTLLPDRRIDPSQIITFLLNFLDAETRQVTQSPPLKSALDLRKVSAPIWNFCSDVLGTLIENALGLDRKAKDTAPWLTDAIYLLLSPSSYPLTSQGVRALAALCRSETQPQRFGDCMRPLAAPDSKYYAEALSRLGEVCRAVDEEPFASQLLWDIAVSSLCTPQCAHGSLTSRTLLLSDHARHHPKWINSYTHILVERCQAIFVVDGLWPSSAREAFLALLSLPLSDSPASPEIHKALFDAVCSHGTSAGGLEPLVSVDPVQRALVVPDAAAHCVVSLVSSANTEDRGKFIHAMWTSCDTYRSDGRGTNIPYIETINLWIKYYKACAEAMSIFRASKYPSLPEDEKVHTAQLAEGCLVRLDGIEAANGDAVEWEANFDVDASAIPDEIFLELARFVPDIDTIARSCKRVRRLQNIVAGLTTCGLSRTDEHELEFLWATARCDGMLRPGDGVSQDGSSFSRSTEEVYVTTEHSTLTLVAGDSDERRKGDPGTGSDGDQRTLAEDKLSPALSDSIFTESPTEIHSGAAPNKDRWIFIKAELDSDEERMHDRFAGARSGTDAPMSAALKDDTGVGDIPADYVAEESMAEVIAENKNSGDEHDGTIMPPGLC